jgi:hypothetical protein
MNPQPLTNAEREASPPDEVPAPATVSTGRSRRTRTLVWYAAAILVPLSFVLYTQQIWEDYFITFRCSRNLCEGKGLVYNPGERVHAFTSPLGVLLPAFGYWALRVDSYVPALWLFRGLSILAFAGGGYLLLERLQEEHRGSVVPAVFFGFLYLLDVKALAFTTNGMETGFMLAFFAWGLSLLRQEGTGSWFLQGLCWAGLMWTRPDGCVYIAALALAQAAFSGGPRLRRLGSLMKSGLVCAVLYFPWFAWAWQYYGSPVPHTITAKSITGYPYLEYLQMMVKSRPGFLWDRVIGIYAPLYDFRGWPTWIRWVSGAVALFAAVYWLFPVRDPLGRMVSLCAAVLAAYSILMPAVFPWYYPPLAMCSSLVFVQGSFTLANLAGPRVRVARSLTLGALASLGALAACLLALSAWQLRLQQKLIEDGNRTAIGLWLKSHMQSEDRVYLEPIGYIGYFSQAHIVDYPGLVSKEVVRLRNAGRPQFLRVIPALGPEWVVMRPFDILQLPGLLAYTGFDFLANYDLAAVFDCRQQLSEYDYVPGKPWLTWDAAFYVFKKKQPVANVPGPPQVAEQSSNRAPG